MKYQIAEHKMKLIELEKCLTLLGQRRSEDSIDQMLGNEIDLVADYVEPFEHELKANMLHSTNKEARVDLMRHYIMEFRELQSEFSAFEQQFQDCKITLLDRENSTVTNASGKVKKLGEYEIYLLKCMELFDMLFNEIQLVCIQYELEFYKILNDLKFTREFFEHTTMQYFGKYVEPSNFNIDEHEDRVNLSKVEGRLVKYKSNMSEEDYRLLASILLQYCESGSIQKITKVIDVRGRPNVKAFGWTLNRILADFGKGIEPEILEFSKNHLSIYLDKKFNKSNYLKSNLYKYFTTKTD